MAPPPDAIRSVLGRIAAADRRAVARARVQMMWCDRGSVIDLSPRGMRLSTTRRWQEGQRRRITICDTKRSITVEARCIWCNQEGLFSHHVGLSFDRVTDQQAALLDEMTGGNEIADAAAE